MAQEKPKAAASGAGPAPLPGGTAQAAEPLDNDGVSSADAGPGESSGDDDGGVESGGGGVGS